MRVLNFGSLNIDYVYSVDHIVLPGETIASKGISTFSGGKGLNQSIALAKAGVEVYHAGMIGNDGNILLETCETTGVNTKYIKKVECKSGHTIIQVDKNGQNSIILSGGANQEMTREYIDAVLSGFSKGDLLLLQNEINLLDYIIEAAYIKEMVIILNPSPFNIALNSCDLGKISMLLINEIEASQITKEVEVDDMLIKIKEMYPNTKIIMTLGGEGSVYQYGDELVKQKIYTVPVIDTTAAGDTFTGYFISSIIHGMSVIEGLDYATKAASIAVSRKGATASIPTKAEVIAKY